MADTQQSDAKIQSEAKGGALTRAFTEHPASVGETYLEHMAAASGFGSKMILSGLACMLHGVFPFLFVRTGRNCVIDLHDRLVVNRCKKPLTAHNDQHQPESQAAAPMPTMKKSISKLQAAE